jgi:hypothetical protein
MQLVIFYLYLMLHTYIKYSMERSEKFFFMETKQGRNEWTSMSLSDKKMVSILRPCLVARIRQSKIHCLTL